MKRILLTALLILCLTMTVALADMTQSDILQEAYALMQSHYGYAPDALQLNQMAGSSEGWAVSFVVINHADDNDGLYVFSFGPSGDLLDVAEPYALTLPMQMDGDMLDVRNTNGKSHDTQSYERLAAFTEKWKPMIDIVAAQMEDPTVERSLLALNARLPDEGAMSYDQARETALRLLAQQPGFSEETARMYLFFIDGYIQPEGFERPVWSFFFYWNSERYGDTLEQAFDNDPPIYICLLFDAVDGTLAAEPIIEYRSPRFSPMDYFARTPAVLAYFTQEE